MGNQHTQGIYKCVVCGNTQDPNNRVTAKVGETEAYPFCGTCGSFYYYPHMQVVILKLILQCKQDYMEFKRQVDGRYRRLPAILHAPFMYEAHRWATSRYAWSLTGPDNAREMLEAAFKYKKQCSKIVSMGAGTGYIEHVFFHAAKELSHEVKVYAYDAMPQKKIGVKFDIEVEMGDVDSLAAFGDMSEDILLLCWPPFGSKVREESQMAYDTILKFAQQGGDFLIYVGDVNATGMVFESSFQKNKIFALSLILRKTPCFLSHFLTKSNAWVRKLLCLLPSTPPPPPPPPNNTINSLYPSSQVTGASTTTLRRTGSFLRRRTP